MESKSNEVKMSDCEKFLEKAKESNSSTVQLLLKMIDGVRGRYYNFDKELEKAYNKIKLRERNETEQDIIEHKLKELEGSKDSMNAEDEIICQLLREKLEKINKSLEKKEEVPEIPVKRYKYYDDDLNWFDEWMKKNMPFPHFYRIITTDRT